MENKSILGKFLANLRDKIGARLLKFLRHLVFNAGVVIKARLFECEKGVLLKPSFLKFSNCAIDKGCDSAILAIQFE